MEEMIRDKRDIVRRVEEAKGKVEGILGAELEQKDSGRGEGATVDGLIGINGVKKDVLNERRKEQQREAWRMISALD